LQVADFARPEERRAPVDLFFRGLGDAHGSHAVAVILSGTGRNGSAGLKRVKEYGGLVIAQDPREAEFADMPSNAIATRLVDLVLPIAQMPQHIAAYFERQRRDAEAPTTAGPQADELESLREVLTLLRVRTGHDFSNYKAPTVHRRMARRMNLRGIATVAGYLRLIRQEPDEAVALMKELLISVTNFFRDPAAWAVLEERVIPRLFQDKTSQDQVRAWVAGCATGEEAYSIAMLLAEYSASTTEQPSVQVFATDLDQHALAAARDGLYNEADVADLSSDRLQRFFQREVEGYRVRRELRDVVLFAHHNLIKDPPFSHLDLITCRNLLIYLNRSIQDRVLRAFHFALRPGGYLFLGGSETPEDSNDLFLRLDANAHIYESRPVTSRVILPQAEVPILLPRPPSRVPGQQPADRLLPADLHQRLLEQFAPPSLIITEEHNVVHISERAGRYLEVRGGEPSRDVLALVRPELRPDLRTAIYQATIGRKNIDVRGITVSIEGSLRTVDVAVKPVLRDDDPAKGYLLVVFEERSEAPPPTEPPLTLTSPADENARHLEEELTRVKAQLRGTIEQYETQVEEAKASNEELQAMNEELRSAAEELETSKEELQSVNEELTTVNQELKVKIEELRLTNNDFQNFINATDIGTIFLDRSMCVKFSTAPARDIFNLLDSDIGRPLSDITHKLVYPAVHKDIRDVLDRLRTTEREVQTIEGRWYLLRLLPYRTNDNRIDGVVLTFLDITQRRNTETQVRQSEERLRALIDSALDYAIFTMTPDGIIDSWNPGAERMFGYAADEIIGINAEVLFTLEDRESGVPARELEEARRFGRASDERYHVRKNGKRFFCSGITRQLAAPGSGFTKIARDLTSQEQAAAALQRAHDDLEQGVLDRTAALEATVQQHEAAKAAITRLLHQLVNVQEDERRRIARDLHDHLGQQLTALRLALERARHAGSADAAGGIDQALALTNQVSRDVDFLSWELRPAVLDELGLGAALPRFAAEWAAHVGIAAECRVSGFESSQLPREAQVAFYRIAQEALNNVAKHAHASRADVVLATNDGEVVLVVEDDGIGFDDATDSSQSGLGLVSMRERAALVTATLQIESSVGKGTSIFLRRRISAPPLLQHSK
jgi:two-component system CheB/CheR fusion protein